MLSPEVLTRFLVMALFTLVFWIMGFVFIRAFFDYRVMDAADCIGMGVSAGLILIIFVVMGLGILRNPTSGASIAVVLGGLFTISLYRTRKRFSGALVHPGSLTRRVGWQDVFPLIIYVAVLTVRAAQIQDVLVPNWIDGFMHASLIDKYVSNARIPPDNIYHVGFHAIALVLHSLGRLSIPETILVLGQWLGAVSGLTLYSLARQYTHQTFGASLSFIVYSLFLIYPSELVSWGRYPLLLGLTLLPFAIITSLRWIRRDGSYIMAVLFAAGLALSHYACLLFWFSFICAQQIGEFVYKRKSKMDARNPRGLSRSALLIFPLFLVILPKAINLFNHPAIVENMIARTLEPNFGIPAQSLLQQLYAENYFLLFIWFLSVLWLLAESRRWGHLTLFWPFVVWFLTWGQFETLRFAVSTYENLVIFLAAPVALAFGFLCHDLILRLRQAKIPLFHGNRNPRNALLAILLIIGLSWGVNVAPDNLDPERTLFSSDDRLAIDWIHKSTTADAGFLINSMIWSNGQLIPSDGGGWIRYLTGRKTHIPALGELYDICEYSGLHGVSYVYFGKSSINEDFGLRLSQFPEDVYEVAYRNQSVTIIRLHCP